MSKYCQNCDKEVNPGKTFSIFKFFILLGIFYLPFYLLKPKVCPSCGLHKWGKKDEAHKEHLKTKWFWSIVCATVGLLIIVGAIGSGELTGLIIGLPFAGLGAYFIYRLAKKREIA